MKKQLFSVSLLALTLVSLSAFSKTEQKKNENERPKRLFAPSFVATIKNTQNVYNLVSKNKWFLDFRQSPLYYGIIYDLYPTLFSLPDEFSVSKDSTWSGRLIDYVYESILKNRPTQVFYYQQSGLSSPWGISVVGLTNTESKVVDQLMGLFRVGQEKEITTRSGGTTKVSLIEIKAQKWAVKKEGSCLSVGRDPAVVADIASKCKTPKLISDLDVDINLSLLFPSLMTLRSRVVGLDESMKVGFKWNIAENRYDLSPISMGVSKENIFVSKKVTAELLRVIPSDSHFFVVGNIKIWNGNMSVSSVKTFLSSSKRSKDFQKQAAAILVQVPIKIEDKLTTENALILESGSVSQTQLNSISEVFDSSFGEVFVRPICSKALVISRSKELVQKVQNVCHRKLPSIVDRSEVKTAELSSQDTSLGFFADLGLWVSNKIEAGYLNKAKEKKLSTVIPEELVRSQRLLEQLPKYMVKGSVKEQNLILK